MKNYILIFYLCASTAFAGPKEDYEKTFPTEWEFVNSLFASQNLNYREFQFSKPEVYGLLGNPGFYGEAAKTTPLDTGKQVIYYASNASLACKATLIYYFNVYQPSSSVLSCSRR